jgi:hypothetical protein
MTDADALSMLAKYGSSVYFVEETHFATPAQITAIKANPLEGQPLVDAMLANLEEARRTRDRVKRRYDQAQRDGLFDMDAAAGTSEQTQEAWTQAVKILGADKTRCISDLKHWREYYQWAVSQLPSREPGEDDEAA